jgi:hypothetical protein
MFLAEWMAWKTFAPGKSKQLDYHLQVRKKPAAEDETYAEDLADQKARMAAERFDKAYTRGPVYACNDTYLEMRCGATGNWRGLITMVSLILVWGIWAMGDSAVMILYAGFPYEIDFITLFIVGASAIAFTYIFFKYILQFTRLEALTSRYLLIRFNRVTRQVYLHRPPYCGSIIVLPWEGVMHVCDPGLFPMTAFWRNTQGGDYGFPTIFGFVGKPSPRIEDHQAQWEFIRRYMDEGGLQAVASPKISSKLPWPWKGLTALAEGHEDFFKTAHGLTILGAILWSPALLVIAFMHWISLLLC